MSDGYTPVFCTVFDGSLYGKWPESAVWLTMLALCDKRGNVDMSFQAIAGRTGWPMGLLVQGVGALMQPDPSSRSPAHEGRRLIPLAEGRGWGWHVVNHAIYREKARLQGKDAARTASGADADRKRLERELSPVVPRSPPDNNESPVVPLSYSYADTSEEQPRGKRSVASRGSRIPIPYEPSEGIREWAKTKTPDIDVTAAAAEFTDFWKAVPGARANKLDWEATFRNRLRELQGRVRQTLKSKPEERPRGLPVLNR